MSGDSCTDLGCSKMHKFHPGASKAFVKVPKAFSIQYGTGSCAGFLAADTVSNSADGPRIRNQTFGLATTVADFFVNSSIDGIWGLGLKQLAVDGVTPPLDNMYAQGIVSKRLLGIKLSSDKSGSLIDFGFVDDSKYAGDLNWYPYKRFMFQYAYYLIGFKSIDVAGTARGMPKHEGGGGGLRFAVFRNFSRFRNFTHFLANFSQFFASVLDHP